MLPDEVREAVEVSTSPRVDELIERVMQKHPGFGASAQARYYEAVHQELAPLARDLEARAERAEALLEPVDLYPAPLIAVSTPASREDVIREAFTAPDPQDTATALERGTEIHRRILKTLWPVEGPPQEGDQGRAGAHGEGEGGPLPVLRAEPEQGL